MGEVLGGRYELVDPLGEGGAGVVWRAWDHRERRYVAAKVLRQSDAATLLRFVREQSVRVVRVGAVPADGIPELLQQVRESTGSWTTTRHDVAGGSTEEAAVVRRVLTSVADSGEIAAAAALLERDHPGLARVLRDYGVGERSSSSSTKTS